MAVASEGEAHAAPLLGWLGARVRRAAGRVAAGRGKAAHRLGAPAELLQRRPESVVPLGVCRIELDGGAHVVRRGGVLS